MKVAQSPLTEEEKMAKKVKEEVYEFFQNMKEKYGKNMNYVVIGGYVSEKNEENRITMPFCTIEGQINSIQAILHGTLYLNKELIPLFAEVMDNVIEDISNESTPTKLN